MISPTRRTLAYLRKCGMTCEVVERWNAYAQVRQDLFGCIDILSIGSIGVILGIQCTTRANQAARMKKALLEPKLKDWLLAGGRFEVWGWAKVGPKGKRKRWEPSIQAVTLEDFQA